MNECPSCETVFEGRFCPECCYHIHHGSSLWARLRAWREIAEHNHISVPGAQWLHWRELARRALAGMREPRPGWQEAWKPRPVEELLDDDDYEVLEARAGYNDLLCYQIADLTGERDEAEQRLAELETALRDISRDAALGIQAINRLPYLTAIRVRAETELRLAATASTQEPTP